MISAAIPAEVPIPEAVAISAAIWVSVKRTGIISGRGRIIHPRFDGLPAITAGNALTWRSPCDVNGIHRQSFADFSLLHRRLISWRKTMESLRFFRDARLDRRASGEGENERKRADHQRSVK